MYTGNMHMTWYGDTLLHTLVEHILCLVCKAKHFLPNSCTSVTPLLLNKNFNLFYEVLCFNIKLISNWLWFTLLVLAWGASFHLLDLKLHTWTLTSNFHKKSISQKTINQGATVKNCSALIDFFQRLYKCFHASLSQVHVHACEYKETHTFMLHSMKWLSLLLNVILLGSLHII